MDANIMIPRDIVAPCLYNHLGYGNLDAPVWFVGVEEGGAEIWRSETLTLKQSLRLRASYHLAMDLRHVWEDLYRIPLQSWKGATTWRFIAAYILAVQGHRPDGACVRQYVFIDKLLGRSDGDHFLCELMPLPKRAKGQIDPYQDIWATDRQYRQAVAPRRLQLLLQTLNRHPGVRLLICYERDAVKLLLGSLSADRVAHWTLRRQQYTLWLCSLPPSRQLYILHTPFFGQGQISYQGVWESTQRLAQLLPGMTL
jgi:hypothetical protein